MWSKRTNNLLGAVLAALWLLWGANAIGNFLIPPIEAPEGAEGEHATTASAPAAKEPEAPLDERLAAADPEHGKTVAKKCQTCHTFGKGEPDKVGPNLFGVAGGPRAHEPSFAYSGGMKSAGGTWTDENLDKFLTKPSAVINGTKMTFAGLPSGKDRAAVIKYLHTLQ